MKLWGLVCSAVLALSVHAEASSVPPAPIPEGAVVSVGTPVELYECVRYKDERNIHPCAVPKIVAVPHPCPDKCACGPQCVYVKICVPPCDCYETKCRRNGKTLIYDFGDYEVEVRVIGKHVVVDYDD